MDTTTLDLLYLEIGQFTKARTNRDLKQERLIAELSKALEWYADATDAEFFNDKGKRAKAAIEHAQEA